MKGVPLTPITPKEGACILGSIPFFTMESDRVVSLYGREKHDHPTACRRVSRPNRSLKFYLEPRFRGYKKFVVSIV